VFNILSVFLSIVSIAKAGYPGGSHAALAGFHRMGTEDQTMSKRSTSRREFTCQVAALAVASTAAAAAANPPATRPAPRTATVGQALAEVIRLRHGRHLTDEQLRLVRASVEGNVRAADRLRRIALQNGDEPAFQFSADVP
jgi:hypothetical protein